MRRYKMPDGRTYQFEDGKAPACAVPVEDVKAKKATPKTKKASKEQK